MIISYQGVQSFKVQFGDTVLAFDPVSKKSEFRAGNFGADIALISLNHSDMNGIDQVNRGDKQAFIINGPGEYEIKGVFIEPIISSTKPNRFLVTARGIYLNDHNERERFGIFIFDDSLVTIQQTIDIIDYADDYEFSITKLWNDSFTLHAESPGKGLDPFDKDYKILHSKRKK